MDNKMTKLLLMLMMVNVSIAYGEVIELHTEKYENGQVKAKGNLADGKRDGTWFGYYESGKVAREVNY
ncbi:MAG: hypothetical protein ACPHO6_10120 [Candidatus Latescibacterota bacterium]